jgi:hypothetical protein
MSTSNNRHVVPDPGGGWDFTPPQGRRTSSSHKTQAEAGRRAKEISAKRGGGEIRVHRRDERIRDSDTVTPGRDPHSPRDTKH